jgi:RNA methyltransferase, TrmH family
MSPGRPRSTAAPIGSRQNRLIRSLRHLERDRRVRDRERLYIAWGRHLAIEALDAGIPLRQVLVGPSLAAGTEGRSILQRLADRGTAPIRVADPALESIVEGAADQGIVLVVERPAFGLTSLLAVSPGLLVVAHGVQDPGNLGSIARTARALGANGLIALEGCADPFGSRAVRAAMGAPFTLPIVCATAVETVGALRAAGLRLVAADVAAGAPPTGVDLGGGIALLLGNEGAGLPPSLLAAADVCVRIPMASGSSSLNVHAAAAILLYEARRQRGFVLAP